MGTFMFDRNGNIKRIDTRGVETPDGDILEDILIKDKSGVIDGIDIDTTANTASLILDNGTEIPLTGGGSGGGTITVTANVAAGNIKAGDVFTNKTNQQMWTALLYRVNGPKVVLTGNPSATVIREKGDSITVNLSAAVTKMDYDIASAKWEVTPEGKSTTITNIAGPNLSTGSKTYTMSETISDTTTYKFSSNDSKSNNGSQSLKYNFVYPMYHGDVGTGITAATVTESLVTACDKHIVLKPTAGITVAYTVGDAINNGRMCFAAPASYGDIKSVKDTDLNFEYVSMFEKTRINFTGNDGKTVVYNVWVAIQDSNLKDKQIKISF